MKKKIKEILKWEFWIKIDLKIIYYSLIDKEKKEKIKVEERSEAASKNRIGLNKLNRCCIFKILALSIKISADMFWGLNLYCYSYIDIFYLQLY